MSKKLKVILFILWTFIVVFVTCIITLNESAQKTNEENGIAITKDGVNAEYIYTEVGERHGPVDFRKIERGEDFSPAAFWGFGDFSDEELLNSMPDEGVVSDAETAVNIALTVWWNQYGSFYEDEPIDVVYDKANLCWYVSGNLPDNYVGGVPMITVDQTTGAVLFIGHSK